MSVLAIRRVIRRCGHRSAGLLALLMVVGVVQLHHSDLSMGDMHDGGTMNPVVMTICIGMLTAVGAAVVAIALGVLGLGRWPLARCAQLYAATPGHVRASTRARAGPPPLLLICVSRR